MSGECPFTRHAVLHLPPSPPLSSCCITKESNPHGWLGTCAGVNPNRGAMVTGHGVACYGSVSLWGVSEGVWRAQAPKNKADGSGNYPTHGLHLFPPHTPPSAPIQPVSKKPSGGLEVEECLGFVHAASDHKVPADSCATLPISLTHFQKQASKIYWLLFSIVVFHQRSDWH